MFVNRDKLIHLLQPNHYFNSEFFELEKEKLFKPAWHFVAVLDEIPNHGDYLTKTVCDVPLLIRNHEGEPRVYLNVCGHRHSRITCEKKGNCPVIRCQYHGWEFKENGNTGRIPDANCFRPFDRENTRLKCFPAVLCGRLIFTALSDETPDFDEFMGGRKAVLEEWFDGSEYHFGSRTDYDVEANWKVPVENTLESYHVDHLHAKTIGKHPEEKNQEHDFGQNFSSLYTSEPPTLVRNFQDGLMKCLGVKDITHKYTHHLIYPNIMIIGLDPMTMIQTYVPVSPTSFRWEGIVFVRSATHWTRKWFEAISSPIIKLGAKSVVEEDVPIYSEVQAGLQSSCHPGVVGTIEERIYAFQEYILHECEGREMQGSQKWKSKALISPSVTES
ncbi:MAG: aromatic ring-hydroxylating dioxygenase subunit alpha [Verrucomicrobiales bacterium]|nr:aromatic ring-hydroxylating dioxygenase subunit alpha [Verrucomicrobiales bacterium]